MYFDLRVLGWCDLIAKFSSTDFINYASQRWLTICGLFGLPCPDGLPLNGAHFRFRRPLDDCFFAVISKDQSSTVTNSRTSVISSVAIVT